MEDMYRKVDFNKKDSTYFTNDKILIVLITMKDVSKVTYTLLTVNFFGIVNTEADSARKKTQ